MEGGTGLFNSKNEVQQAQEQVALQSDLYEQVDHLNMELEWLEKKLPGSVETKRTLLEPDHPQISVRRQCELVGLNRSTRK